MGPDARRAKLRRERLIAGMAIENILNNVSRLVKRPTPKSRTFPKSQKRRKRFKPDAIVSAARCAISIITSNRSRRLWPLYSRDEDSGARDLRRSPVRWSEFWRARDHARQARATRATRTIGRMSISIASFASPIPTIRSSRTSVSIAIPGFRQDARILRVWQNHGLATRSRSRRIQAARDVVSLPQPDDGEAQRRPTDLHRAVSPREVVRRLEQEPHALGASKRVARRPHTVREFPD